MVLVRAPLRLFIITCQSTELRVVIHPLHPRGGGVGVGGLDSVWFWSGRDRLHGVHTNATIASSQGTHHRSFSSSPLLLLTCFMSSNLSILFPILYHIFLNDKSMFTHKSGVLVKSNMPRGATGNSYFNLYPKSPLFNIVWYNLAYCYLVFTV